MVRGLIDQLDRRLAKIEEKRMAEGAWPERIIISFANPDGSTAGTMTVDLRDGSQTLDPPDLLDGAAVPVDLSGEGPVGEPDLSRLSDKALADLGAALEQMGPKP